MIGQRVPTCDVRFSHAVEMGRALHSNNMSHLHSMCARRNQKAPSLGF